MIVFLSALLLLLEGLCDAKLKVDCRLSLYDVCDSEKTVYFFPENEEETYEDCPAIIKHLECVVDYYNYCDQHSHAGIFVADYLERVKVICRKDAVYRGLCIESEEIDCNIPLSKACNTYEPPFLIPENEKELNEKCPVIIDQFRCMSDYFIECTRNLEGLKFAKGYLQIAKNVCGKTQDMWNVTQKLDCSLPLTDACGESKSLPTNTEQMEENCPIILENLECTSEYYFQCTENLDGLKFATGYIKATKKVCKIGNQDQCDVSKKFKCGYHLDDTCDGNRLGYFFPENAEQMERNCPVIVDHIECLANYFFYCEENSRSLPLAKGYLQVAENVCEKGSPLYRAVVRDLDCVKPILTNDDLCNSGYENIDLMINFITNTSNENPLDDDEYRPYCWSYSYHFACEVAYIGKDCPESAKGTWLKIHLELIEALNICQHVVVELFPEFVDFLQENLMKNENIIEK